MTAFLDLPIWLRAVFASTLLVTAINLLKLTHEYSAHMPRPRTAALLSLLASLACFGAVVLILGPQS